PARERLRRTRGRWWKCDPGLALRRGPDGGGGARRERSARVELVLVRERPRAAPELCRGGSPRRSSAVGLPPLRLPGRPGPREPALAPAQRALQDAPRVREGASLRGGRGRDPRGGARRAPCASRRLSRPLARTTKALAPSAGAFVLPGAG